MKVAPLPVDVDRLFRRLRDQLEGELLTDATSRYLYSTDASYHLMVPLGVARPRHIGDLAVIASTLHEANVHRDPDQRIGLTMRSAGTSLTGGSIGHGLVVDVTRHFNRILSIDTQRRQARVQPGVTYDELSRALAPHGLMFPPNPASGIACELGGMWANNASGTRHVKYGPTRDWVDSLRAVSAAGEVFQTGPVTATAGWPPRFGDPVQTRWADTMWPLVRDGQETIRRHSPAVNKNASGYALDRLWQGERFDFGQLLVGSEGTLALFAEAQLRLAPILRHRSVALLFFDAWERAGEGVGVALPLEPVAVEMVDRHLLDIARPRSELIRQLVPEQTETALLVEFESDDEGQVQDRIAELVRQVVDVRRLAFAHRVATDPSDQERLWTIRKAAAMIGHLTDGRRKPVPFIEACVVQPHDLPAYIRDISAVFERHHVHVAYWGHAGNGNMHVRPALDLTVPEDLEHMRAITEEVFEIVDRYGGSYTAEHGDGYTHSHLLARRFGPLYSMFEKVKAICDPLGFLNPDKIITHRDDQLTTALRMGPGDRLMSEANNPVVHDPEAVTHVENCIGLGVCKDFCPSFFGTRKEQDLTRGRTNAMRGMMTGAFGDPDRYLCSAEFRAAGDTCLNCKRCAFQCPSQVDEPRHLLLARRHVVEHEGMPWLDGLLAHYERLAPWGVRAAPLVNAMSRLRPVRWGMERALGVDRRRTLPRLARQTLDTWYARRGSRSRDPRGQVIYFAGCFARFNEPSRIGRNTIRMAELLGYHVSLPNTRCSGHALETYGGDITAWAQHNIAALESTGSAPILTTCSSCRLSLVKQYVEWFSRDERWARRAQGVAARVVDAAHFGARHLASPDKATAGSREEMAYHAPCHAMLLRELGYPGGEEALRAGGAHARLVDIPQHCSGMGGTFGFKRRHRTIVEANARNMVDHLEGTAAGATVYTDCPSCRLALEEHSRCDLDHPVNAVYRWLCHERNTSPEEET